MTKTATAIVTAAAPVVAKALETLPNTIAENVEFSYTTEEVTVTLAYSLSRRAKTQGLAHVMIAFKAAGWTLKVGRTVAFVAPDAAPAPAKKATRQKAGAAPKDSAPGLFSALTLPVPAFSG